MIINAKTLPVKDIMRYDIRVDGTHIPFVFFVDTDQGYAEVFMSCLSKYITKDEAFKYKPLMIDGETIPFTIHRFDVYKDGELIERV